MWGRYYMIASYLGERGLCLKQNEKLHLAVIKILSFLPCQSSLPFTTLPYVFPWSFSHTLENFVKIVFLEKVIPLCVLWPTAKSIYPTPNGSHCCFAILILISHLFPHTLFLAGIRVSLLTHLIHYLPFPFSPDNNHPTLLRNSQVNSCAFSFFLISTLKQKTFTEYQSCARHYAWAMVCQKWYSWLIFVYTTPSKVPWHIVGTQ